MKPLLLKMTAFGPYAKQTILNFKDDLAYQDIFVVTGPTGAGKTTIFDAICYALYGETSGGNRSGKELRSDFAKDSDLKTEVEFTFQVKEKTYRIIRTPQQLQKKKRGEGFREVPATVELLEIGSEQAPLTKDSEVRDQIQQIIGLKVEQFRKIVMIPQGDFKEFLLANTTNKEEILRKIFGTDFYKQIQEQLTQQANALKSDVVDTQKMLQAELKLLHLDEGTINPQEQSVTVILELANEQQAVWKESVKGLTEKLERLGEIIQDCRLRHEAGMRVNEQFIQYEEVTKSLERLHQQKPSILEREHQIQCAKAASNLMSVENEALKYKALKQETKSKRQQFKQSLSDCETEFILVEKCYLAIESLRAEITCLIEKKSDLTRYIEGMTQLEQKSSIIEQLKVESERIEKALAQKQNDLSKVCEEILPLEELKTQFDTVKEKLHTVSLKELKLKEDLEYVQSFYQRVTSSEKTNELIKMCQASFEKERDEAQSARKGYEHQAELFINAAAIRLANELKVGQACPVCGSLEHPNPRRSDETILSKSELDQLRYEVEELEQTVQQTQKQLTMLKATQLEEQRLITELTQVLQGRSLITIDFKISDKSVKQLCEQLKQEMSGLSQQEEEIQFQLSELDHRINHLTQLKQEISSLEKEIEKEQLRLQKQREHYKVEQRLKKELEENIPQDYRTLEKLHHEVELVEERKVKLEQEIVASESDYQRLTTEMASLKAKIEEVTQQLTYYEGQFEEANTLFLEQLQKDFQLLERYEEAKSWMNGLENLENIVHSYYQELHAETKLQKRLQEELKDQQVIDLTHLEEEIAQLDEKKAQLTKESARLSANLEQNDKILTSVLKKYQRIKKREQEYAVIGELDALANGRSGRKISFETYVLSSYFDEVLASANIRLQKMTSNRYYLLRKEEGKGGGRKGLDLDIYDSHTCKQRPVNTLSGGESFKASLALALGLSDTVQQNSGGIQLDTMFIDEGFGTLDSESLDQAIDILMELQDHGRLIGVISHVNELKERIPAKLVVETDGAGSYAYFKK